LSAVAETKTSVAFIGVGETPNDLERFEADRFISACSAWVTSNPCGKGSGDTSRRGSGRRIHDARQVHPQGHVQADGGNEQLGPLKQIMQMLPMGGLGLELSDKEYQATKDRLDKYRVIMDSMTEAELEDPKIITASRMKRISMAAELSRMSSGSSSRLIRPCRRPSRV